MKNLRAITSLILAFSLPVTMFAQTPASGGPPVAVSLQPDFVSLDSATEQFLRKNLTVEAARLEISVAEAERIGARLRPRPGLTASAENLRLSGETPASRLQEFGVTVEQPIELGNRKALRMEVAERTISVSEARLTASAETAALRSQTNLLRIRSSSSATWHRAGEPRQLRGPGAIQ